MRAYTLLLCTYRPLAAQDLPIWPIRPPVTTIRIRTPSADLLAHPCVQTDAKAAEGTYQTAMDKVKDLEQQLKDAKARAEEARRAAAEASHKAEDAEDEANSRLAAAEKAVRIVSSPPDHQCMFPLRHLNGRLC